MLMNLQNGTEAVLDAPLQAGADRAHAGDL
jgi:hypothetical protein